MLSVCTDFPYHVAIFLQGVDLINDQTKRLVSLGIWTNLLPVSFAIVTTFQYSVYVYYFRLRNDLYCVEWGVKLYSLVYYLL